MWDLEKFRCDNLHLLLDLKSFQSLLWYHFYFEAREEHGDVGWLRDQCGWSSTSRRHLRLIHSVSRSKAFVQSDGLVAVFILLLRIIHVKMQALTSPSWTYCFLQIPSSHINSCGNCEWEHGRAFSRHSSGYCWWWVASGQITPWWYAPLSEVWEIFILPHTRCYWFWQ